VPASTPCRASARSKPAAKATGSMPATLLDERLGGIARDFDILGILHNRTE